MDRVGNRTTQPAMDTASLNNPFLLAGVAMMILGLALSIRAMFQASALRALAVENLTAAYRQGLKRGREEGEAVAVQKFHFCEIGKIERKEVTDGQG